jgi:hypothetical protein
MSITSPASTLHFWPVAVNAVKVALGNSRVKNDVGAYQKLESALLTLSRSYRRYVYAAVAVDVSCAGGKTTAYVGREINDAGPSKRAPKHIAGCLA